MRGSRFYLKCESWVRIQAKQDFFCLKGTQSTICFQHCLSQVENETIATNLSSGYLRKKVTRTATRSRVTAALLTYKIHLLGKQKSALLLDFLSYSYEVH